MSKREAVLIVSRAVALYLLCWALSDLTYLPERLFALSHHAVEHGVIVTNYYYRNLDILSLAALLVRIAALLIAAAWLYKCGPRVEAFFLPSGGTKEVK